MFSSSDPETGSTKPNRTPLVFSLFHEGTLAVLLITFTLTFALVWFGLVVKQKVTEIELQWQEYSDEATLASHVFNRIQKNFGYSGFIHNFKNYILRKDQALIPDIEKSLAETRRAIKDYPLHGITQDLDVEIHLNNLSKVVDQYVVNFELAKRLIAEGVSSNDIYRQVKVNDVLAFYAIQHLSQHAIENNDKHSLQTSQQLENTLNFINWLFLIIPIILLSSIYFVRLFQKISKINDSLEESRMFLSDLFDAAPDAMLIINSRGHITEANQEACNLFNYSRKDFVGVSVESLIPKRFRKQHVKTREESFNVTEARMLNSNLELYALGKNKKEIPVDISLSFTTRNNEKNAIVTLRDITEKRRAEESIKYLAQYDQLTNLPNRALFNDRLKHAVDRAQRNNSKICLMFIDLDGFKNVNDSFGHQAGDELLQIIAERLSNIMRTEDTVARYGGDEFTIIMEEIKHSDYAAIVANKILQAVRETIYLSGNEVTVGASIGISIFPENGNDASKLIENADISMYQAKKQGKNCYKFFIKDYLN